MRAITTFVLVLLVCAAAARAQTVNTPAPAPTPSPAAVTATPKPVPAWLDRRVRAEAEGFSGSVYLYAKNLDTGAEYSFGGDEPVRTASTIKVAVMVEAFARVAEGKAKWSDELVLGKAGRYAGAGVWNELTDGLRLTLRDAVTLRMERSDNTATNMVLDYLSTDAVNDRMQSLGLT